MKPSPPALTAEHARLQSSDLSAWRRFGPYVAERSWGTVREDYSRDGEAWAYFPHDNARSRAYRWGEDGLGAVCDRYQVMVLAFAFWNERDPILKERLFGVVPTEGNHGEDVKELYYYLDSTPTHSYMRWLYKYPQRAYPYAQIVEENQRRGGRGPEYELLDTGAFDEDRYFDIFVEYAKAGPEDLVLRLTAHNRGPDPAPLHLLPHLWFRNTWGWGAVRLPRPEVCLGPSGSGFVSLKADDRGAPRLRLVDRDYRLGERHLYIENELQPELLFTDNETNGARVFGPGAQSASPYTKDAFHRCVVDGERGAINPDQTGTKAAAWIRRMVPAGGSVTLRLRLSADRLDRPFEDADRVIEQRLNEADEFYRAVQPPDASADEKLVQRQALAGLLWSKQLYLFDVDQWLDGDNPSWPPSRSRIGIRNTHWRHLSSMKILSMPDKWEYPWFAAWDLAFHAITFAIVDPEFAKDQLWLLLFEQFLHPSGQIPAYEWEFSDLNPPVHPWAVWRVYNMDRVRTGKADRAFLERCFHKLLLNFAFWVNKVDQHGNNVFEGGFLGLDNITVLDRSKPLPPGMLLEQSDGTGWMGMVCLQMMRIALELAKENQTYEALATKFFQHYIYVASAMKHMSGCDQPLWDVEDGFFYDMLRFPDGHVERFRVRSLVGLVPLYAVERLEETWIQPFSDFRKHFEWFVRNKPITQHVCHRVSRPDGTTHVLAIMNEEEMRGVLRRLLDPDEFMSQFGLRSLSKAHQDRPYRFDQHEVRYEPAESDSKLKGGNSNWRGPIWFPTGFLMIEALRKLGTAYGPELRVPCDGKDGPSKPLREIAEELANRMIRIFTRDEAGRRPVFGANERLQRDPHFKDYVLFYEYFHGDDGTGLGASHQTGWTALAASLIDEWRRPAAGSTRA